MKFVSTVNKFAYYGGIFRLNNIKTRLCDDEQNYRYNEELATAKEHRSWHAYKIWVSSGIEPCFVYKKESHEKNMWLQEHRHHLSHHLSLSRTHTHPHISHVLIQSDINFTPFCIIIIINNQFKYVYLWQQLLRCTAFRVHSHWWRWRTWLASLMTII